MEQSELSARLAGDRVFSDMRFASDIVLDELDFTEARFERCHFQAPAIRGADFTGAAFIDTDLRHATMLACALDRAEWDRAKLRQADLRGSNLLNLAVPADYAGVRFSDSEQSEILEQLGVDVCVS